MLILGIDASARQGSVALLREQEGGLLTLELLSLAAGQPSETLVPAIDAVVARHGIAKRSLSLVAVASGPGSFTGLRVALATAKGLAEAFAIPILPVSVLEAIALIASASPDARMEATRIPVTRIEATRIEAVLDAQRNELFVGEFLLDPATGLAQTIREDIAAFPSFVAGLAARLGASSGLTYPMLVTPDEALATRLREAVPTQGRAGEIALVRRPTAEDVARIAHRKFLAGFRADAATLDANYLRRSEAEIVCAPKLGIPPR